MNTLKPIHLQKIISKFKNTGNYHNRKDDPVVHPEDFTSLQPNPNLTVRIEDYYGHNGFLIRQNWIVIIYQFFEIFQNNF